MSNYCSRENWKGLIQCPATSKSGRDCGAVFVIHFGLIQWQ